MTSHFLRRTLAVVSIAVAAVAIGALVIAANGVLLVLFGAVLAAMFLSGIAELAQRYLRLPSRAALPVVILVFLLMVVSAIVLFANKLIDEAQQLGTQLPEAQSSLIHVLRTNDWARNLVDRLPDLHSVLSGSKSMWGRFTGILSDGLNVLANGFVVCIVGIFLAAQPHTYVEGLLRLTPVSWRPRGRHVARTMGKSLQSWLLAQLICMTAVAVLTGTGLLFLHVRLAFVLAVIAGALDFIPTIGPLAAAIPAVLLALLQGPQQAALVVALYLAVQSIENYILQPFVQREAVDLPPALTLSAQLLFGVLLGIGGLILATPLTVITMVLTRMLYIEDVLGDRPPETS